MPQMGVSVSEGTITKWLKQVGEAIGADEPLLEISTDKVDTEVPSPGEGVVAQILVQEGETVEVGTKLAVIAPAARLRAAPASRRAPPPEPATAAEPPAEAAAAERAPPSAEPPAPPAPPAAPPRARGARARAAAAGGASGNGKTFVSPVVARIAAEHGVDLSQVSGTGRGGRVTKKDILALHRVRRRRARRRRAPAPPAGARGRARGSRARPRRSRRRAEPAPAQPAAPAARTRAAAAAAARSRRRAARRRREARPASESLEPMTAMRRGIAEHMRRSLDTSAHVTSAIEVDMSRVVAIREKLKKEYQKSYGVNPTYLIFVARAVVETLRDYPWINGEIRGDKIVTRNFINLGFAVELADGKGLIVPVVKHAEGLNLLGMARAVTEIAQRARDKKLLPDDVQGGTFTITNPGGYGTFHGTPVISQPQAAILGTYAVVKRPWVVQDELGKDVIAIRPIMNLTLTYDHRLVDGALAGRFLRDLRDRLESWDEAAY